MDMNVAFGDVFSTRRPKNVSAGVSSGLKSLGKGLPHRSTMLLCLASMS